jgi:hypothetical protein
MNETRLKDDNVWDGGVSRDFLASVITDLSARYGRRSVTKEWLARFSGVLGGFEDEFRRLPNMPTPKFAAPEPKVAGHHEQPWWKGSV